MHWNKPTDNHIVYEALSAIADDRIKMTSNNTAKCTSTSRGKYYEIKYDPTSQSIMSNDNMAYYRDEVSYPMVAFLLLYENYPLDHQVLNSLKGIRWKDINQKNKNNYLKSVKEVLENLGKQGVDLDIITKEFDKIFEYINKLKLKKLGEKTQPPNNY